MTGARLSVGLVDADASTAADHGTSAERAGLDGIWILGSPHDRLPPGWGDSGVITTAMGVAGVTTDIRIGLAVTPRFDLDVLRTAEDLGVLDQASGGRIELLLDRRPMSGRNDVAGFMTRLLRAWDGWVLPTGQTLPVTPRPVQPWLPVLVSEDEDLAATLGAGVLTGHPQAPPVPRPLHRRVLAVTAADLPDTGSDEELVDWIRQLRVHLRSCRANELLVRGPASDFGPGTYRRLAALVHPGLRCPDEEVDDLVRQARRWWAETERGS